MNKRGTIEALCRMPKDHRERGNVSMVALLKESGYLNAPDEISSDDIEHHLRENPELIDIWRLESENQRSSHSWYFMSPTDSQNNHKAWVVGFYPDGHVHKFQDRFKACAFYIKIKAEGIRQF